MKILFLSPWFPSPIDNGAKIRIYNLLSALSFKHEITLLSFAPENAETNSSELARICQDVRIVPARSFKPKRLAARLGYFSKTPRSLVDTYNDRMVGQVRRVTSEKSFDALISSTIDMAAYALQSPPITRLLDIDNFTTRMMKEQYQVYHDGPKRWRYWLTWLKWREYEKSVLSQFDGLMVVSEKDKSQVSALLGSDTKLEVIENSVDLAAYQGLESDPTPGSLVFNGSLRYRPNLDAMEYFFNSIWGDVRHTVPNANLKITGSTDGIAINQLCTDNSVTFTGPLKDVRSIVAKSWVSIAPLRIGGGSRLKILEAMALGTPVISSTKGAEGLEVTHMRNILIADAQTDFKNQIILLLGSPELRKSLSKNAKKLVREKYDTSKIGPKFEEFVVRTAERRELR